MARTTTYPRAQVKPRAIHVELARQAVSLGDLAERAALSRQALHAIANGLQTQRTTAERIARALGVDLEQIFEVINRPAGGEA